MLWKELHIERVGSLGRFGSWVGGLLVLGIVGLCLVAAGVLAWDRLVTPLGGWPFWAVESLAFWVGGTATFLSYLIQWGVGLRAGVVISSERERGTWDALLTSPLEGGEIVVAKVWGSLFALRWLVATAALAWAFAAAVGAMPVSRAVTLTTGTFVVGGFMAAVGVRTSLASQTATRAMSVTIGVWLLAVVATAVLSTVVLVSCLMLLNSAYVFATQFGAVSPLTALWMPVPWEIAWPVTVQAFYLLATLITVGDTALRFDLLAGRANQGGWAAKLERLVDGPVPSAGP